MGGAGMRKKKEPTLEIWEAEAILRLVFLDCGETPDMRPMEELTDYSLYRKESFWLQRIILIAALIMFMLVPIFFVQPTFQTSYSPKGERGLPVYTITVDGLLPVKRVVAVLDRYRLPVYEVNSHEYTIEPTENGTVDVTVELFNGQLVTGALDVRNADVDKPRLLRYSREQGEYVLYVTDDGVGVDFDDIYAISPSGTVLYPESFDREKGSVIFGENVTGMQICIPDYFGNVLKIAL
jgi:hypothetical protein